MFTENRIFCGEIRKLVLSKLLYGFFACCLALNITVIAVDGYAREEINSLSRSVSQGGYVNPRDIFEGYDAMDIAEQVNANFLLDGLLKDMVNEKYESLQPVVNRLAEEDAALDYYAGPYTFEMHERLFSNMLRTVVAEGCLTAMLLFLYLMGYEQASKTENIIYSTKKGRSLVLTKLLSAGVVSVLSYAALCAATFSVYFSAWDYSGFWNSSVSSANNYIPAFAAPIPFITWQSFTVGEYFWAVVAMGALLIPVFLLFSTVFVLALKNTFAAFLGIGFISFVIFCLTHSAVLIQYFTGLYFLLDLSPVMLWFYVPMWFTDACGCSALPHYELTGVGLNLVVLGLLLLIGFRRFRRKDILV